MRDRQTERRGGEILHYNKHSTNLPCLGPTLPAALLLSGPRCILRRAVTSSFFRFKTASLTRFSASRDRIVFSLLRDSLRSCAISRFLRSSTSLCFDASSFILFNSFTWEWNNRYSFKFPLLFGTVLTFLSIWCMITTFNISITSNSTVSVLHSPISSEPLLSISCKIRRIFMSSQSYWF